MRFLALIAVLTSLAACGGPGYARFPLNAKAETRPSNPGADTIWLVAVDGLRANELRKYLRTLRREHHEPRWRSGISMLQRTGKRLVRAQNAETSISTGRGALATLLTGYTAQVHGQPASAWIPSPPKPQASSRWQVAAGGVVADYDSALGVRGYFETWFRVSTLFDALPDVRSASIFLPFAKGHPVQAFVPTNPGDFAAWLDDRTREHAAPQVDRSAREAAVALLQSPDPPNLLVMGMRGVHGPYDQQTALRLLDGHLARMVAALRRTHPDRISRLHVVLVGTSPTTELTQHPRHFDPAAVRARLTELMPRCAPNFGPEQLRVVAAGRTARVYIAPTQSNRACLHDALRAARLHASAWLDGAAWRFGDRPRTFVSQRASTDLGAIRTRRLIERLEIASGGPLGDALLFAAPTITFDQAVRETEGGIRPEAVDAPLLLISNAISDATADRIASAPIELTDIAPTLVHLLGGEWPKQRTKIERRAPLLTAQDGQWTLVPSARLELPIANRQRDVKAVPAMQPIDFGTPALTCQPSAPVISLLLRATLGIGYVALHWDSRYAPDGHRSERLLMPLLPQLLDDEASDPLRVLAYEPRPSAKLFESVSPMLTKLRQLRREGPIGPRQPRRDLLARFGETPAKIPPRDAFLSLIVCDAYDRCASKPLMSDRDFETLAQSCQ